VIERIRAIKFANKTALSQLVAQRYGIALDPLAMFDCQVKRIHEYKRQLLNILHVIALYLDIKETGVLSRLRCICLRVKRRRAIGWRS
jgi:starch phosphorylase